MRRSTIVFASLVAAAASLTAAVPTRQGQAQGLAQPRHAEPDAACGLQAAGLATVRAVRDDHTLLLDDGREVRLAGLETPTPHTAAGVAASMAAKAAIEALVADREIALKTLGRHQDRYGRTIAYVQSAAPHGALLQTELLRAGHARVAARIGSLACARDLLAAEKAARENARGLWSSPDFAPREAGQVDDLLREAGDFALVSGKILSVRESGATIYMNFGSRWSRDFSVTMLKRNQRLFSAAGIEPKQLEGRQILVRGVLERRGGPLIEAARPEQIEIVR